MGFLHPYGIIEVMKTDEEIKKNLRVFVDENGVFNVIFDGTENDPDNNTRFAEITVDEIFRVLGEHPDREYNFFIDLTKIEGIPFTSSKVRRVYARLGISKQMKKTAVAGNNAFMKYITMLVAKLALRKGVQWFDDRNEAYAWIVKQK